MNEDVKSKDETEMDDGLKEKNDSDIVEESEDNSNSLKSNEESEEQISDADKNHSEKDEEIAKLQGEVATVKDLMLRRQADFENYKKRALKLQKDFKKFAVKDFALDIITINDDLLRAIDAASNITEGSSVEDSHKSFVDGVSMISSQIEDALKKYEIVEIIADDKEFDPNLHECVEIEVCDDVDCETVCKVYQKGFKIDDVVIRTSRVKVAKPEKQKPDVVKNDNDSNSETDGKKN